MQKLEGTLEVIWPGGSQNFGYMIRIIWEALNNMNRYHLIIIKILEVET